MRRINKDPESCNERCNNCSRRFSCRKRVSLGYERLAFGSTCDAFKMLTADNMSEIDPEKLDLFNVAEIKKPKDGALEIKFFDRLKALEYLSDIPDDEKNSGSFYEALNRCADQLERGEENV